MPCERFVARSGVETREGDERAVGRQPWFPGRDDAGDVCGLHGGRPYCARRGDAERVDGETEDDAEWPQHRRGLVAAVDEREVDEVLRAAEIELMVDEQREAHQRDRGLDRGEVSLVDRGRAPQRASRRAAPRRRRAS